MGYYKLGSDCLLGCPANFYVSNSGSRTCDACAAPCLTCSLFTYSCTSCNNTANLYLQSANRCVSTCDANYFLENNICTACKAPCLLCTTSSTTCQSCSPSSSYPIWLNYTCISASACPIGYYILVANYSCNACPVVCTVCSSSASCSACATGYSLLNHYCVSTCPNTTFPV